MWATGGDHQKRSFVCKYAPTQHTMQLQPPDHGKCPSDKWIDFESEFCYLIRNDDPQQWQGANFKCLLDGASLLSIHSLQEEAFLAKTLMNLGHQASLWIGLVGHQDSPFSWTDGSPLDHENWAIDEPNGDEEHCVELIPNGFTWNDNSCNNIRGYICKINKIQQLDPNTKDIPISSTVSSQDENISNNNKAFVQSVGDGNKSVKIFGHHEMVGVLMLCLIVAFAGLSVGYYYRRKFNLSQPAINQDLQGFNNVLFKCDGKFIGYL